MESIKNDWPGLFREKIFPILPVHLLIPHYSADNGRPSHNLRTLLGLMVIQHYFDFTDQQTLNALARDIGIHYALRIDDWSDTTARVSRRTWIKFRNLVVEIELLDKMMADITAMFAEAYSADTSCVRMDSVHIESNTKNIKRSGVFASTITSFLKSLRNHNKEAFGKVGKNLASKYLDREDSYDYFNQAKPSETHRVTSGMAGDLFRLVRMFEGDPLVSGTEPYLIMARVLSEQCRIIPADEYGDEPAVEL
ncbi:MAG: transposase [Deltaproteobacteria bacterium]|nr:transposase [Deltaproteobacteria bacterium]